jgi:hypothetical protein
LFSYSFSTLAPSLVPVESGNAVLQSTKCGLTSGANFARVKREQRIISSTVRGAGYHTDNVAEHYVHNSLPADGGFVTDMANLDTATSADRETVATLTKEIATLTEQLKSKDMLSKSQEAELKRVLGGHATAAPIVPTTPGAAYVRKS